MARGVILYLILPFNIFAVSLSSFFEVEKVISTQCARILWKPFKWNRKFIGETMLDGEKQELEKLQAELAYLEKDNTDADWCMEGEM